MDDLSEKLAGVTTTDLIVELTYRSHNLAFISLNNGRDGELNITYRYKGDADFCIGLCETLKLKIDECKKQEHK